MKISRYVVKVKERWFNTVTQEYLPLTATEEEITAHYFAEGQEHLAINARLFANPETAYLIIIPTWECNLRCGHCSVLTRLVKEDPKKLDLPKMRTFLAKYLEHFPSVQRVVAGFVGGEPLLRIEECLAAMEMLQDLSSLHHVKFNSSLTTNLTVDLTEKHLKFFHYLDSLVVSIDGNKEEHNLQRHSITPGLIDPYDKTINNLDFILDQEQIYPKVSVQSSLSEKHHTTQNHKSFLRTLLRMGMRPETITFGCIHPTDHRRNSEELFLKSRKIVRLRSKPCCKFRYMSSFLFDTSAMVYDNFYKNTVLGTLDDDMSVIEARYRRSIEEEMPALHDKVCLNECPVIGYCWGECINGDVCVGNRPSAFCNRKGLEAHVRQLFD